MEPLENSQDTQRLQRRASIRSTTPTFPHSHSVGLTGSETSPKTRESCSDEPTLNGHHDNDPDNSTTALSTARKESQTTATALDLRHVIYPPLRRHVPSRKRRRFLDHFPAIIRFVWESRFAERSQIQRRFFNPMASDRTAQYQLESLTILGYLGVTVIRGHASRHRHVYFVKKKGLTLLDTEDAAGDDD